MEGYFEGKLTKLVLLLPVISGSAFVGAAPFDDAEPGFAK